MRDGAGAPVDFAGLANRAPRAADYADVLGPEVARDQDGTGYEAARFALDKPPVPFMLRPRPPIVVQPFLEVSSG